MGQMRDGRASGRVTMAMGRSHLLMSLNLGFTTTF